MRSTFQRLGLSALSGGANDLRNGSGSFPYASTALSSCGRSPTFIVPAESILISTTELVGLSTTALGEFNLDLGEAWQVGKFNLDLGEPWSVFFNTLEQSQVDGLQQRVFWKLFDAVENYENAPPLYTALLRPVTMSEVRSAIYGQLKTRRRLSDCFSEWLTQRDLSARDIRSILDAVAFTQEQHGEVLSARAVLSHVHETLTKEVNVRVKQRSRPHRAVTSARRPCVASTHDWVLAFVVHTGISPPTWACTRLTVGWALVLRIKALEVTHEKVRRRQTCRDLRNAFCGRCARARFYSGSRDRISLGGCSQSPRRGRTWPDPQAAQYP
jgi:hypothetical protein